MGKSFRLLPLSKLKGRPVRKPLYPGPGPDPRPLLPACPVPTPSQPQASLCKRFSSACPADLPCPRGSLELDKIFYDPTLRYALLKAPMLASAGASARPSLGASSPKPPPLPPSLTGWWESRQLPPHPHHLPSQSRAPSLADLSMRQSGNPLVTADLGI